MKPRPRPLFAPGSPLQTLTGARPSPPSLRTGAGGEPEPPSWHATSYTDTDATSLSQTVMVTVSPARFPTAYRSGSWPGLDAGHTFQVPAETTEEVTNLA